jgi:hypothetical protein
MPVRASSRDRRTGGACTGKTAVAIASSDDIRATDVSELSREVAGNVVDTQAPRGISQSALEALALP